MTDIEKLRAELAAMTKERDEWKSEALYLRSLSAQTAAGQKLTAAQATNAKLRGYLQRIVDDASQWDTNYPRYLDEAFALPTDDTALKEALAAERERCAVAAWNHYMDTCKKHGHGPDVRGIRDFICTGAIRSLK